tara:strand:- start:3399 stop:3854 length:456 start_codon:yes stop_codon:yes gene_type:complete
MEIQNPIHFLMNHYYHNKYVDKKITFRHKSINYYIGLLYNKTARNKKFNKITYVYNPFLTSYYKRHIVEISKNEITEILDLIDSKGIINNPIYHLNKYYEEEPLNRHQQYSLYNYNFYDMLFFDYLTHKNRKLVYKRLKKYEKDKLTVQFD